MNIVDRRAQFAAAEASRAPELLEIATTRDGRDITRGYVEALPLLPPQDTVLAGVGGSYETYQEVLRDDQVGSTFAQRRLAVVSKEWEVLPGGTKRQDKRAADFLSETLARISWDSITDKMLHGLFYGYAVAESIWASTTDMRASTVMATSNSTRVKAPGRTLRRPAGEGVSIQRDISENLVASCGVGD